MARRQYGSMAALGIAGALVLGAAADAAAAAKPSGTVQVYILAGQSNMEGKAKVSLLETQLQQPATREQFAHLWKDGGFVVRDDVWIKFLDRRGNLTVGFGSPDRIGPELEFGNTVGDHHSEPVLLIKTAWGGKSLFRGFRPPSSGLPAPAVLDDLLAKARKKQPDTTMDDVKASFGEYYRGMLAEVADTLDHLAEYFPEYEGQGYVLRGFVWFQGWNDMINPEYTAEYTGHMANFIRDVRRDLGVGELPFVIGQLGVGGVEETPANPKKQTFKEAQAAAARLPEFAGNVAVVQTDQFWDQAADAVFKKGWKEHQQEWQTVGSDFPYHYLGSVKTYNQIGKAFGAAVIDLQKR